MDKSAGHNRTNALYPRIEPFDRQILDVGDGHSIYMEQCGNPTGKPVVILHGGPGGGCSPTMRRYFDPRIYRIILFDQRGCGKSRPHASITENTTWHLVRDIELIRTKLGIDSWIVFGGSWGACLALIYGICHGDRVDHLVLRGVFMMTRAELHWFYGGGAGAFCPDAWARFEGLVPKDERHDLITAYGRRLFGDDPADQTRFARAWAGWENSLASARNLGRSVESHAEYARAFSRIENSYFANLGWLDGDDWIMRNAHKLTDIPGHIVHGKNDLICPPATAWQLAQAWPRANLQMIPGAGHALSEPATTAALLKVMDDLA